MASGKQTLSWIRAISIEGMGAEEDDLDVVESHT